MGLVGSLNNGVVEVVAADVVGGVILTSIVVAIPFRLVQNL